jgi:non-canonical purine NTP pyrophosphatase (RdgB/HAM1 family)
MKQIYTLVSSNIQKRNQWKNVANDLNFDLNIENLQLLEIQDSVQEIASRKARDAFEYFRKPVIVEDVSLEIKDWDNNPGPYIKYFPNHILPVGSLATFVICIAVIKVQSKVECFTFKTSGKICKELHGKNTFGFDSVLRLKILI